MGTFYFLPTRTIRSRLRATVARSFRTRASGYCVDLGTAKSVSGKKSFGTPGICKKREWADKRGDRAAVYANR